MATSRPDSRCIKRLAMELKELNRDTSHGVRVTPDETDITKWYFIMPGPFATPFEGGEYMGILEFPSNYPFSAPSICLVTPSGAFLPSMPICMTMTSYHNESWSPAWKGIMIILGLSSFMSEYKRGSKTFVGAGINFCFTEDCCKTAAQQSHIWNTRNSSYIKHFM